MTDLQFQTCWEKNYNGLVYFAMSIMTERQDAEDMVSEAIAYLWSRRDKIEFSKGRGLLYGCVRHRCLNEIIRKNRAARNHDNILTEDFISTKIRESWLLNEIYTLVRELPDKRKAIFLMTYRDGLKCPEIAEALGINKSSVTTQLQLARDFIRDKLNIKKV